MSTIDEIQKLCEQYISRRFGKREKRLLQEFLRDIAVQGKEEDEEEKPHQSYQRQAPSSNYSKPAGEDDGKEKPEIVGKIQEGSYLHQKASQYTQVIQPKSSDPKTVPVKVSDLDVAGVSDRKQKWAEVTASDNTVKKTPDETGYRGANDDVKGLKKNWETGAIASTVNVKKTDVEDSAYKVSDASDIKNRLQSWETGQVAGQVPFKKTDPASAEYKVADLDPEEVKKRKLAWESGQVSSSAPIKKIDTDETAYRVQGTEDMKSTKQKWETGQGLIERTSSKKPEADDLGYKVDDGDDVKKRLQSWETGQVAGQVQVKKTDPEQVAYKVADADVKARLQNWETGKVATAGEVKKTESDVPQGEMSGVKDRLNKWSEVTKEPTKSGERKQPISLPDKNTTLDDLKDVVSSPRHKDEDEEARIEREMKEAMAADGNMDIEVEIEN